jgi:hypothetical protein
MKPALKKSDIACRNIRAATNESEVIAAVREYLASLNPVEAALVPCQALASGLMQAEEMIHAALHLIDDAGKARKGSGADVIDETRLVFTAAAKRLAALAHTS